MCLLLTHPADTDFDYADIVDFYTHNKDGLGVMWSDNDILYVQKTVPRTAGEAWEFYKTYIKGKDCVVHFRMQTHGDTDTTNCHPHEVFGDGSKMPLYMAHNGILHTGNDKDKKLSDTIHYINDYLRPVLSKAPDLIFEPAFIDMLEDHIGTGNKFIFMDNTGRIAIVNEKAFVDYKGAKLSNTYAWSASKGGYGFKGTSRGYGYPAWWDKDYDDDTYYPTTTKSQDPVGKTLLNDDDAMDTAMEFFELLDEYNYLKAYSELTYTEVVKSIDECGEELWDEFYSLVLGGYQLESDIIEAVRDVDYLVEMLYPTKDYSEQDDRLTVGMV